MNILILNGSPKGENSVTLQTMRYLRERFPGHAYCELHVSQRIRSIEKDFSAAREALLAADLLVFCYPVYTFLVPALLHRFIERIKEDGVDLQQFPFSGGCLGCFHCAADGTCVYKDGFDTFLREKIQTADATVYAFAA